ncbi:MAG TPA: lysophospholipid acyltransferase family protein [bacterium]|nr:lysophospholipid acyltransferase family protein [Candidatus Omnitrophota bacterium]HOL93750.1 lysophospholipid acyltransferase family protein [bacterium]
MMNTTNSWLPFLASLPAYLYIQLVGKTNRFRCVGPNYHDLLKQKQGPFLFALWHSRVMIPVYHVRGKQVAVIVSRSRDGEYIAQVMKRFRIHATRGSAFRSGTEGLLGLVHWLKNGGHAVVPADGPRGPREVIQPGIIQLARLTGVPITPICLSASRCHRFNSWDRFVLPYPFGTIYLASSEPIPIPRDLPRSEFEAKRLELEQAMRHVTEIADALAAGNNEFLTREGIPSTLRDTPLQDP